MNRPIKERLVDLITFYPGIKNVELATKLIVQLVQQGIEFEAANIADLIEELVASGEICEVEHVI